MACFCAVQGNALVEIGFSFEFVSDEYRKYEERGAALFIMYVSVDHRHSLMLLNLLIAILSTSLAKVQEKVGQEFRVSRARLIDR